jgi:hypothetical protein
MRHIHPFWPLKFKQTRTQSNIKIAIICVAALCTLAKLTNFSEVVATSITSTMITLMMHAASTSEMLVTSTRLHGATT